jgi:hypothetical protein
MKTFIKIVIISFLLSTSLVVYAETPTEKLGVCLIDNLNGKERKMLAKWIFFAIAAHPEISSYSNATSSDVMKNDKEIGSLITRLLTEDCPNELKAADQIDPQAIEKAFELVGQVAMQEVMTNQAVSKTIANYVKYTDQEKINKILLNE